MTKSKQARKLLRLQRRAVVSFGEKLKVFRDFLFLFYFVFWAFETMMIKAQLKKKSQNLSNHVFPLKKYSTLLKPSLLVLIIPLKKEAVVCAKRVNTWANQDKCVTSDTENLSRSNAACGSNLNCSLNWLNEQFSQFHRNAKGPVFTTVLYTDKNKVAQTCLDCAMVGDWSPSQPLLLC